MEKTGIALFVYNRPYHTSKVLEGLKSNKIKKLYIFADGIPKNSNSENTRKIIEVRELINKIEWCDTQIILHKKNLGLKKSALYGYKYIFEKHSRIIALEDDCLPSRDFINFMETCLDKYENNKKVMNICGYALPIDIPQSYPYDVYFSYRQLSWGTATWKSARNLIELEPKKFKEWLKSREFRKKLRLAGRDVIPSLKRAINNPLNDLIGIWWGCTIIKYGYNVCPVVSRIINIGQDGSGLHSGRTNRFDVSFSNNRFELNLPENIILNKKIIKKMKTFVDSPSYLHNRIIRKINKIIK